MVQLIGLVFLLILSGFFSSTEVAFFSLDAMQVRRIQVAHPSSGARVQWILSSRTRLLSTILIGNTLVNVAVPAVIYSLSVSAFGHYGAAAAIPISLLLLLIFGEIGPKRFAVAFPDTMARLYSLPLVFFTRLLSPFRILLTKLTVAFEHRFHPRGDLLSDEEFETVVDLSGEEGVLEEEEQAMLKGIIRLEDLRASDIMTPRVDVIGIDLNDPEIQILDVVRKARVRKVLLYRDSMDHVDGLLDVRKFLLDPEHRISAARLEPPYVPEACPLDKLLALLLKKKRRTAVVVDEYGGMAGLVTRGDILEEIVGDVDDERGAHELLFQRLSEHRWVMDGRVHLERLSEDLEIEFEEEGMDRIGGWVTARLERMPHPGDSIQYGPLTLIVRQMRKNSVSLVEIIRDPNAEEDAWKLS